MQKLVLYSAIVVTVLLACSKDKYENKPNIKIKSIDPTQAALNQSMSIRLEFTDKQGDLDTVWVKKERVNTVQVATNPLLLAYQLPDFPEKTKGEIQLTLDYNTALITAVSPRNQQGAPNNKEPDTLILKFIVKDKAGNISDTIASDKVVIERY